MVDPRMMNGRRTPCGCNGRARTDGYRRPSACCEKSAARRTGSGDACCEMRKELRRLEFSIVDVALYLDAYPECEEALAYYRKLLLERDCLRKRLTETCGPLTIYENGERTSWDWVEGPWPWHPDAD